MVAVTSLQDTSAISELFDPEEMQIRSSIRQLTIVYINDVPGWSQYMSNTKMSSFAAVCCWSKNNQDPELSWLHNSQLLECTDNLLPANHLVINENPPRESFCKKSNNFIRCRWILDLSDVPTKVQKKIILNWSIWDCIHLIVKSLLPD